MTISVFPSIIGRTSFSISAATYWLSASVFTMISAPFLSQASKPAMKPFASPLFLFKSTT